MGGCASDVSFKIGDNYSTIESVQLALRKAGLESSNLIIGIDFTKSNTWTGEKSFNNQCLHTILPPVYNDNAGSIEPGSIINNLNPYEAVITIIGQTLEVFDDDKLISAFGFGDLNTQDKNVFNLGSGKLSHCNGFQEVLNAYHTLLPKVVLSGPTNFGPLIRKAVEIVSISKSYHILLIVADGQVNNLKDTIDAIVYASGYPLSIIMIGVGDGPWDQMKEFDDGLPERKFDNFQFVNATQIFKSGGANIETKFALQSLMEIPEQYKIIRDLHLL